MVITFITSNKSKAEQLRLHLDHPIKHKKLSVSEIQSLELEEVVKHKAREAYKQIKSPVLVEDTSLVFYAFGRLPGPLIKWFLEELDNEGLCRILDGYKDRSAIAKVCFGLYAGKALKVFKGEVKGSVAKMPKGERSFGWDPIFIPEGYTKTWGEMDDKEQKQTSMRRIALKQLENYLKEIGQELQE